MRQFALWVVPLLAVSLVALVNSAPAQVKNEQSPYHLEFDNKQDVLLMAQAPEGEKKDGTYVKVRFSITLDGNKVTKVEDDYTILIEENGKKVKEVPVPRPVVSDDLSVMLVIDTSGSMKEHGRMQQARESAAVFLKKLPPRSDCGLILFDHEIRERVPILSSENRNLLLEKINSINPRGGTAYLDAAFEGIQMLAKAPAGRDRALVLMTDGIDLNSSKAIVDVIQEAKKKKVRVYTIGIGEPGKLEQVSTVLVLDHSGSMRPPADDRDTTPKIEALHQAAFRFVDSMSSVGRASIVPFSTTVETPLAFREKKNATLLRRTIKSLEPDGETALLDATYEALCVLDAEGPKGKRAVVAMTDGIDNTSRRRVEEVLERANETKIPLYMLGFGREGEIDDTVMRQMALSSGGKYYHARNKDSLIEIFENLSIQLHDDGIDEPTLRQIAQDTGGQYYPAKNVAELKFILEQVTKSIQRESYEVWYSSPETRADGTERAVALKLLRGAVTVGQVTSKYFKRGLIIADMDHVVYLVLLVGVGGLIALPALARRGRRAS